MRILEEVKYGVERHRARGSTDSRICRKLHGKRGVTRTVQILGDIRERADHMTTNEKGSMGDPSSRKAKQQGRVCCTSQPPNLHLIEWAR